MPLTHSHCQLISPVLKDSENTAFRHVLKVWGLLSQKGGGYKWMIWRYPYFMETLIWFKSHATIVWYSMSTCPFQNQSVSSSCRLVTRPAACHGLHVSLVSLVRPLRYLAVCSAISAVCRAVHDILNRKLELKSKGMVQNCPKSHGAIVTRHPMKLNRPKTARSHPNQHFGLKIYEKTPQKPLGLSSFSLLFHSLSLGFHKPVSGDLRLVPIGLDAWPGRVVFCEC